MSSVTFLTVCVIGLGVGLMAGSLIIEGAPGIPPGPIFLSGFYILCLGALATGLSVLMSLIGA